jgi:hypothetical protein
MTHPSFGPSRLSPIMARSRLRPRCVQLRTAHGVGDAGRLALAGCNSALADPCPMGAARTRGGGLYRGIALCAGFL